MTDNNQNRSSMRDLPDEEYDPYFHKTRPLRRHRKPRKVTLGRVAREASKAGIEVARYDIAPDGKISIVTSKSVTVATNGQDNEPNEWDEVFFAGSSKNPARNMEQSVYACLRKRTLSRS